MSVSYERINWEDSPSTATPINAENLNKMDEAISELTSESSTIEDDITDLKADFNELGLSVVNGALCVTYNV